MKEIALDEKYRLYLLRKFPDRPDAILETQANEVLKYLYLVSMAPAPGLPLLLTTELDDIWHYMIIETKAYLNLCESLPSGAFIHHSSNDYPGEHVSIDPTIEIQRELLLYANYVHLFGGFKAETVDYWPGLVRVMQAVDLSDLESLNDYFVAIAQ